MVQRGDGADPVPIALPAALPLFPLGTVLFPGAWLPLHIFEQRYRQMLARCLGSAPRAFVVLLIKEGDEVVERADPVLPSGRPAVPHQIGTIAHIVEHRPLPDGRSFVICRGAQRVQLDSVLQEQPYLVAEVRELPDEDAGDTSDALRERAAQARRAAERLIAAIEAALPREALRERSRLRAFAAGLPKEPASLSYALPQTLGSATAEERQTLLAAPSTRRRLELALPLLFREQQVIEQLRALGQAGQNLGGDSPFGPITRPSVN